MRVSSLSLLLAAFVILFTAASLAQVSVGVAVSFGPPALPIYEQPPCPTEGYLWVPGYWAYDYDFGDYYWVPGTWIEPPQVGLLWTPGYWAWGDDGFLFHQGYWGPQVGFYGGIAYGFGYFGEGYEGGRWDHDRFYYNRAVNNVNVTNIHNVYNTTVVNNTTTVNRVSYNGGNGGITARPSAQDEAAARERHIPPVPAQTQHVQAARNNQQLRASVNQGKPPVAATPRPAAFNDRAVVPAKQAGAPYHPPANRTAAQPHPNEPVARQENNTPAPSTAARPNNAPPANRAQAQAPASRPEANAPAPPTHAKDVQPHAQPAPPSTENSKAEQKYQQQQEKLNAQQQQEHQKLQQQQEKDHQRSAQQPPNEAKTQQLEQQHQQQTQAMEQHHVQQQQQLQQRQPQPPAHAQAKPPAEKQQ